MTRPTHSTDRSLKAILGTPTEGDQIVALFAMTLHDAPTEAADSLTVLAIDRTGRKPVTAFVPTGTLVQIPALTYGPAGDALSRSDYLQKLTIENLLGVGVDRTFVFDEVAMGQIIDAIGGVDVDVTEEIFVKNDEGGQELMFEKGPQHMGAAEAVLYMSERGDATEVQRFSRQQKVWEAIYAAGSAKVDEAVKQVNGASLDREAAASLAELLGAMAARPAAERVYEPLPAVPKLSGGDDESYTVDTEKLDLFVQRAFAPSAFVPGLLPTARPRIEIRNGVGTPGVGERAAAVVIENGMRLVLGSNAQEFGLKETKIFIYGMDADSLALGERIKKLLGVGRVEIARGGQTVVQVTIVIGRDYVKR